MFDNNEEDSEEMMAKIKKGSNTKSAKKALLAMGYEIILEAKPTANGPDLHVKRNGCIFRIEVKTARKMKRSMAVHPIEPQRKNDDLVAVQFPSGYVFIEPMEDYLKACAPSGSRSFFGIY